LCALPMAFRPTSRATRVVVPLPWNGSRTVQGTGAAGLHVQVGSHPTVCLRHMLLRIRALMALASSALAAA
jgi:hypothetical protein